MRVLMTGASGFLGKHCLRLAIEREEVQEIVVLSRQLYTHPSPKVKVLRCDLAQPGTLNLSAFGSFDQVLHLAGLYDLAQSYAHSYLQNVVLTLELMDELNRHSSKLLPVIHFASTYAIGIGLDPNAVLFEDGLQKRPGIEHAYALTKFMAEESLMKSAFRVYSYRLGILVGEQEKGTIEKIDGPYFFLKALWQLKRAGILKALPVLPIPAAEDATMPLIPVDFSARVMIEGMIRSQTEQSQQKIYYNMLPTEGTSVASFIKAALEFLDLSPIPVYWPEERLGSWSKGLSGIPEIVFRYVKSKQRWDNRNYRQDFPLYPLPEFRTFDRTMFKGLSLYLGWNS